VSRSPKVACKAIEADAATRVRGHTAAVYKYFVNPANFPAYRPAVQESRILKGYGPDVRSQWQVNQSIGRMQVDVTYDIIDLQPDRRVVYSLTSDLYTGTEQTVFMPDPNDPSFTVVRTVSSVELNLWKRAMQPFLSGSFKSVPERNLQQLAALLNSAKSPIRDTWGNGSSSGNQASRNPFTNFFSGRRASSSKGQGESSYGRGASGSSSKAYGATKKVEIDSLGYYAALGLDGRRHRSVRAEDVKSAFRRSALVMHPDKFSMDEELMADEERRTMMEENYKKITRAYEVLKDPEQKRLYDEGRLPELQQKQ